MDRPRLGVCKEYQKCVNGLGRGCQRGVACKYSHDLQDKCFYHQRSRSCHAGNRCLFQHTPVSSRAESPPAAGSADNAGGAESSGNASTAPTDLQEYLVMASNSFLQAQGQEWIHQHKRSLQLLFHPDKTAATTLKVQPLMQALWLQFQKVQES